MHRLTIKLSRELSERLTWLAKQRGVSRSALAREAIELLTEGGGTFIDRVSKYVGAGTDAPADILTNWKHMKRYGR